MENTVFYLSTCDTCKRILKELGLREKGFIMREIKSQSVTEKELAAMYKLSGSYESLFSRQSRIYKAFSAEEKTSLTEEKMKNWILKEYTFLKRPVIIYNNQIYAGNSSTVVNELKSALKK